MENTSGAAHSSASESEGDVQVHVHEPEEPPTIRKKNPLAVYGYVCIFFFVFCCCGVPLCCSCLTCYQEAYLKWHVPPDVEKELDEMNKGAFNPMNGYTFKSAEKGVVKKYNKYLKKKRAERGMTPPPKMKVNMKMNMKMNKPPRAHQDEPEDGDNDNEDDSEDADADASSLDQIQTVRAAASPGEESNFDRAVLKICKIEVNNGYLTRKMVEDGNFIWEGEKLFKGGIPNLLFPAKGDPIDGERK